MPAVLVAVFLLAMGAAAAGIGVRATYGGHAAVDEPQYLLTALSLAEDGDLDISDELAAQRWRAFHGPDLPVQTAVLADGRQVSPHDPGLPLLLAAPMALGGWVAAKLTLALLAGATAALLLWVAVRRFSVPLPLATAGTAVAVASPPLAVYGQQVYPELPAALAVLIAVAALTGTQRGGGLVALALAVVALPWLSVKYAPVAAVLALLGLVALWRSGRRMPALCLLGGLGLAGAMYLGVHRLIWGGWTPYASGDHFAASGEFGVVGVQPNYVGRSLRLVGLLVDRGFGLAAWQPAVLLAVPALVALVRRRPAGFATLALPLVAGWLVATYVALTMHGFWWPGRQVVVVLPLAVILVLWWLAGARRATLVVAGLAGLAGVVAYLSLLLDGWAGQITWVVGFEAVDDPIYQAWRLLLPDYRGAGGSLWARHAAWIGALLALAWWGWRDARPRRPESWPQATGPRPLSVTVKGASE
jgi:hypothetical protein